MLRADRRERDADRRDQPHGCRESGDAAPGERVLPWRHIEPCDQYCGRLSRPWWHTAADGCLHCRAVPLFTTGRRPIDAHLLRCSGAHLCGVAPATPPRSLPRALQLHVSWPPASAREEREECGEQRGEQRG